MITLWYGFFVAGVSSIVLLTMMQAQSLVSLAVQNGLIHQPFSANILTKTQFILLALLEAPLLLAGVCSGYLLSLTTIGSHINVVETIILLLSLGIASCMSLIHCIKPARSFIQALAAHPQGNYSSSTLQHLLLFISLMQTPFIFCLVSVLISANKLDNGFLVVIAPLFVSLSCIGVLHALGKAISSLALFAHYTPSLFSKLINNFFVSLALIEAPILFSFIISILLIFLNLHAFFYIKLLIFCLTFLYGLVTAVVSNESAEAVSAHIKTILYDIKLRECSARISLLSQIFLDARILYMFIIIVMIIFRCVS